MGGMFVFVMVIAIIVLIGQAIKEQIDLLIKKYREYQHAYDIYCQYPHIFINRLESRYVQVNETSDSADIIREKIANNRAVRYFQKNLERTLSKAEFIKIWKQIIGYWFYHTYEYDSYHRIQLSDLEYDIKYDAKIREDQQRRYTQQRMSEAEERKKLKDEYGKWF